MHAVGFLLMLLASILGPTKARAVCANDTAGDTLPFATEPVFDVTRVCIVVTPNNVRITLTFDPLSPDAASLASLGGYVDFDLDRNVETGRPSSIDSFSLEPPLSMGVDYYLGFYPGAALAELVYCPSPSEEISKGIYDVTFADHTATVVIPRSSTTEEDGLPVSGPFDYAAVLGNGDGPTDRVPNDAVPLRFTFPGDFDSDGDVDLRDFSRFQDCFNGPNFLPRGADCVGEDLDSDGDVDLVDFAVFQACFNGPNQSPAAGCPSI